MGTPSVSSKAKASAVYTKTEMNNAVSAKVDQANAYTKTEGDTAVATKRKVRDGDSVRRKAPFTCNTN